MTPALKAMVEAMLAELHQQADDSNGVRGGVVYETGPGEYTIDARGVDLEKVARAGLAAIKATEQQRLDAAAELIEGLAERWINRDPYTGHGSTPDERENDKLIQRTKVETSRLFDAILKDTP